MNILETKSPFVLVYVDDDGDLDVEEFDDAQLLIATATRRELDGAEDLTLISLGPLDGVAAAIEEKVREVEDRIRANQAAERARRFRLEREQQEFKERATLARLREKYRDVPT